MSKRKKKEEEGSGTPQNAGAAAPAEATAVRAAHAPNIASAARTREDVRVRSVSGGPHDPHRRS
mgnify:CR=1 FL=1